ncbi:hypothetical protein AJ79_02397 [Helicocarpus griseus UAMH5409]|uniref:Thioesterase domain-containing protein n=1 Tax=Helicocarpus griseus UAMH5409 TaxID=1447875 RepID=A0A2B7Y2Z5_9EURO|nr:hypothetical protein AJ79_02397 [Helicocarpus griseus UAMH5409]
MTAPVHTREFEDAIRITPLSSHTYSADLSTQWSVGSAPNGGYIAAILHRLSTTHFKNTHPARHSAQPMPISMQLSFIRRSAVGPAYLTVRDIKLGARTSTIQVTMSQANPPASPTSPDKLDGSNIKVAGYITISDPVSEAGVTTPCSWKVHPPPPDSKPPQLSSAQDAQPIANSPWKKTIMKHAEFRRASANTELWEPVDPRLDERRAISDQWSRLRPLGQKGGLGRWTNESVAYLVDIFPVALGNLEDLTVKDMGVDPPYWFPTIALNIDFKKPLLSGGLEWLYSRITTKAIRNGRTDIEVVVLDEQGEVVALATQLGLIIPSTRNTGGKQKAANQPKNANL